MQHLPSRLIVPFFLQHLHRKAPIIPLRLLQRLKMFPRTGTIDQNRRPPSDPQVPRPANHRLVQLLAERKTIEDPVPDLRRKPVTVGHAGTPAMTKLRSVNASTNSPVVITHCSL
uniref:(northern house mosquito) hypothetical protein n=1 Tax=Culex pipiens TaxID=7175 RepID=A0A8D8ALE1_CULPI